MALTITANSGAISLVSGSNPLSIVSGVTVSAYQYAVYGNATQAWTITNQGTLLGTGGNSPAVKLLNGGIVTNSGTAARIAGGNRGVYIENEAGTVSNQGTIAGTFFSGVYLSGGGTVRPVDRSLTTAPPRASPAR